jgi:hypothetical protein
VCSEATPWNRLGIGTCSSRRFPAGGSRPAGVGDSSCVECGDVTPLCFCFCFWSAAIHRRFCFSALLPKQKQRNKSGVTSLHSKMKNQKRRRSRIGRRGRRHATSRESRCRLARGPERSRGLRNNNAGPAGVNRGIRTRPRFR